MNKRKQNIKLLFKQWNIQNFKPSETFRLINPKWPKEDVYPPAIRFQKNIEHTIKLADKIRNKWNKPVRCLSGYRPPLYNDIINGAESSMHLDYRALDLQPMNGDYKGFQKLVSEIVNNERDNNDKIIGFGKYKTFIHIDTGFYSYNRNWDRL